jgi:outer membrane protein OmpA-like peptidoglycan-associated protein
MKAIILFFTFLIGVSFSASSQTISSAHEVYFAVGANALNAETKATLDGLVSRLKKAGDADYEVLVYGYADPTGDEALNLKLSIKRINSVADYLEANGIATERVVRQIPRGETQTRSKYVNTEADLDNNQRRSVELIITPTVDVLDPSGAPAKEGDQ